MSLSEEFRRIKQHHKDAMKAVAARDALMSSVIRVFSKGTSAALFPLLVAIDVDTLERLDGQERYRGWFEQHLESVAQVIADTSPEALKPSIYPGYKWGHAAKILNVYLKNVVLHSRYFPDNVAERISYWLYCPIDSFVISMLGKLHCRPPFMTIKEIADSKMFYDAQELLRTAADENGVPPVWFDDNWGARE